jgi:tetratricopeptide (TPR) repeat protein
MKYYYALPLALIGASMVLTQSQVALGLSAQKVEQIVEAQNLTIADSGLIINRAGNTNTVLTADHMVKGATKHEIILSDLQSDDVKEAIASFSSSKSDKVAKISNVVAAVPKAEDFFLKGNQKYQDKDFQGAIADYTEAIRLNPNFVEAYDNRGLAREKLKDLDGAINDYTQAIKINPNDAYAYFFRGSVRKELKDFKGAINDYTQGIKINPNFAQAYVLRGIVRDELKDFQGAINDYTQGIKINPNYAEAYGIRGFARYQLGDKQGAINDLQKAAELFQQQGKTEQYQKLLELIRNIQQ